MKTWMISLSLYFSGALALSHDYTCVQPQPHPPYSLYLILHVISLLGYHPRVTVKSCLRIFLVVRCLRADQVCVCVCLAVVCWFAEKRPRRCTDWWEGMIYVAPVSQLSSGPLSLITAIRLPLRRCSPCLRPAITASLLSHIHKGKGRILSPRLALRKREDAQKGASMCSGTLKVVIHLIMARKAVFFPPPRCCPSDVELY